MSALTIADLIAGNMPDVSSTKQSPLSHIVTLNYVKTDGYKISKLVNVAAIDVNGSICVRYGKKEIYIQFTVQYNPNGYDIKVIDIQNCKRIDVMSNLSLSELFELVDEFTGARKVIIIPIENIFTADCTVGDVINGLLPPVREVGYNNEEGIVSIQFENMDGIAISRVISTSRDLPFGRFTFEHGDERVNVLYKLGDDGTSYATLAIDTKTGIETKDVNELLIKDLLKIHGSNVIAESA